MFAPATTTHGTLLARIAVGTDPLAWRQFCEQYEAMIRAFARRQGVVGTNADDVVQDVLLALTRAMPGFEYRPEKGKFRSYLKTIIVRSISRRRENETKFASLDVNDVAPKGEDDPVLDAAWEEEWRQQHLRRALKTIEPEFNTTDMNCFRVYVLEGVDAASAADRLGINVSQVYSAKHRILGRLRQVIAAQVADEG